MKVRGVFTLFLLFVSCVALADGADTLRHWGASVSVSPGAVIVGDKYQDRWQKGRHNLSVEAAVSRFSLPSDSDAVSADYGYPSISAFVRMAFNHGVTMHKSPDPAWGLAEEVDYDTKMGNTVSFYATFTRPLYRDRRWMLDYALSMGFGYSHHKYDPHRAIDNELIGARWLIHFGMGAHATYRVAPQWGVRAGVEFWHLSNGALDRPNKGANFIGPALAVVYDPCWQSVTTTHSPDRPTFRPFLYCDLTLGAGAKSLLEEWNITQYETPKGEPLYRTDKFSRFMAYSAQADLMCRYARRWASGLGIDVFYGSYASRVERIDEKRGVSVPHSPWSLGLAVKHQVYYHRLSLAMSVGYYLYREMGFHARIIEKPYYERIGLRYAFPRLGGLAVGASVKAHLTKADFTELSLSMPIRLTK